jgi:CDP-diacylglycerol--glycerol-3-phosphate 3-phosphatidyltransferase
VAARGLIAAHVTANEVTAASLALGGLAGVLVANGFFAFAATIFAFASLGDALDGAIARSSGSQSSGGALFDACADRYEEFFFLAGLAFRLRAHPAVLALVLCALLGSFMVSYGSAKAEALGVPVPGGRMRRAQRAACLSLGAALVPISELLARRFDLPEWTNHTSLLCALALLAVIGNASAIIRLRAIAFASSPDPFASRDSRQRALERVGSPKSTAGLSASPFLSAELRIVAKNPRQPRVERPS